MSSPWTILLLLFASAAANIQLKSAKLVTADDLDKENKVKELFTGLGTGDVYAHQRQSFPYGDPSLYTDTEALMNFTTYWQEGFLAKYGVFHPSCRRTGRDMESLFKLFNATKDFDTFYQVAKWAKDEVHPEMFVWSLISAIVERPDAIDVSVPMLYEALPNYFVPSTVVDQTQTAYLAGIGSRRFQINNTGWEWTWHHSGPMASPHIVHQSESRFYDVETRLSYFREDVRGLDYIYKNFLYYGLVTPNTVKEITTIDRLGEVRYTLLRWILTRYNLERYSVGLPPVKPINFKEPIETGYDPQIMGLYGRSIPGRANNIIPRRIDPEGVATVEKIVRRILDIVDAGVFRNWTKNGFFRHVEGIEAVNILGNKLIAGDKKYYPSLYFNILGLIDGLVSSTNRIGSGAGTLLNTFTLARDPAYYQILAYVNRFFDTLETNQQPYSKKELGFPGVTVVSVETTRLETYFEYRDFKINNLVSRDGGGDYKASQFRINHKPFSITIKVNSEVEAMGMVKIFLGPSVDVRNNSLSLNELRKSLILYFSFPVRLHKGNNIFQRATPPETPDDEPVRDGVSYIRRWCHYPNNMILPKGSKSGTPFKFYVVLYRYDIETESTQNCIEKHLINDYEHTLLFPVDRHWVQSAVNQSNHKVFETFIYHNDNPDHSKLQVMQNLFSRHTLPPRKPGKGKESRKKNRLGDQFHQVYF